MQRKVSITSFQWGIGCLFVLSLLSCSEGEKVKNELTSYKTTEKENLIKEFYRIWDAADVTAFEKNHV